MILRKFVRCKQPWWMARNRICRESGEQRETTNGGNNRIYGHCAGRFADADVCGGAKSGGGVSGDLVLLRYFSIDAAHAADLRAAGGVWICGGGAGDLPAD